jgi:uncharacterized protein
MADTDPSSGFGPIESARTALLTTFRPGGEPVGTPLSIAVANGKARRLAENPEVTLAPCTVSGKVTGETVAGRARLLDPEGRRRAAKGLLKPTRGLFWSLVMYRLLHGRKMVLFEVVPVTSRG